MPDCTQVIIPFDYFCTTVYTGDGSDTDFAFDWPYLSQSDFPASPSLADLTKTDYVRVWVDGTEVPRSTWWMPNSGTVRFISAPENNTCIVIRRDSEPDKRDVTFTSGERHTAGRENFSYLKNYYLIQELWDQLVDVSGSLDGGSDRNKTAYHFTGDGSTTTFALTSSEGDESGITNEAEVLVLLDGAAQHTTNYTMSEVSGVSNVVFDTAPYNGQNIQVLVLSSGVRQSAVIGDGEVTGEKLADCVIDDSNFYAKVCLDNLASTAGDVFIWDTASGGLELTTRQLTHDDISDFDAAVTAFRVNEMQVPNAQLNMNNNRVTNMLDPIADQHAATKKYVDDSISDASISAPSAGNITLAGNPGTFDVTTLGFVPSAVAIWGKNITNADTSDQHDMFTELFDITSGSDTHKAHLRNQDDTEDYLNLYLNVTVAPYDSGGNQGFTLTVANGTVDPGIGVKFRAGFRYLAWRS